MIPEFEVYFCHLLFWNRNPDHSQSWRWIRFEMFRGNRNHRIPLSAWKADFRGHVVGEFSLRDADRKRGVVMTKHATFLIFKSGLNISHTNKNTNKGFPHTKGRDSV